MAELTIAKSLNKAYRQVSVDRALFETFKIQLRKPLVLNSLFVTADSNVTVNHFQVFLIFFNQNSMKSNIY